MSKIYLCPPPRPIPSYARHPMPHLARILCSRYLNISITQPTHKPKGDGCCSQLIIPMQFRYLYRLLRTSRLISFMVSFCNQARDYLILHGVAMMVLMMMMEEFRSSNKLRAKTRNCYLVNSQYEGLLLVQTYCRLVLNRMAIGNREGFCGNINLKVGVIVRNI